MAWGSEVLVCYQANLPRVGTITGAPVIPALVPWFLTESPLCSFPFLSVDISRIQPRFRCSLLPYHKHTDDMWDKGKLSPESFSQESLKFENKLWEVALVWFQISGRRGWAATCFENISSGSSTILLSRAAVPIIGPAWSTELIIFKHCCSREPKTQKSRGSVSLMQHRGVFATTWQYARPLILKLEKWRDTRDPLTVFALLHTDVACLLKWILSKGD